MLIPFFTGILLITVFDQITKLLVVNHMMQVDTVALISNVFHLTYCENPGAGFGIFAEYTELLSILTIAIVATVIGYVIKKRPESKCLIAALTFMVGGAMGNLVDRIRLGYVVDFFDFRWIQFPIFNVADCFVTVGAILFAVYILFFSDKKEQTDGIDQS